MRPRDRTPFVRATLVSAVLAGALFEAHLGCANTEPFTCTEDRVCDLAPDGRCEADGHCSYPDDTCPLGRRYRDAADGAPCIGGEAIGTDSGSTGAGADTSSGSSSGSGSGSGSHSSSGSI